jgi:hypothetical protein
MADPASANPGPRDREYCDVVSRPVCKRCAERVEATQTESGRQLRRPLHAIVRQNSLRNRSGEAHIWHTKTPSEGVSARRSEGVVIDRSKSMSCPKRSGRATFRAAFFDRHPIICVSPHNKGGENILTARARRRDLAQDSMLGQPRLGNER